MQDFRLSSASPPEGEGKAPLSVAAGCPVAAAAALAVPRPAVPGPASRSPSAPPRRLPLAKMSPGMMLVKRAGGAARPMRRLDTLPPGVVRSPSALALSEGSGLRPDSVRCSQSNLTVGGSTTTPHRVSALPPPGAVSKKMLVTRPPGQLVAIGGPRSGSVVAGPPMRSTAGLPLPRFPKFVAPKPPSPSFRSFTSIVKGDTSLQSTPTSSPVAPPSAKSPPPPPAPAAPLSPPADAHSSSDSDISVPVPAAVAVPPPTRHMVNRLSPPASEPLQEMTTVQPATEKQVASPSGSVSPPSSRSVERNEAPPVKKTVMDERGGSPMMETSPRRAKQAPEKRKSPPVRLRPAQRNRSNTPKKAPAGRLAGRESRAVLKSDSPSEASSSIARSRSRRDSTPVRERRQGNAQPRRRKPATSPTSASLSSVSEQTPDDDFIGHCRSRQLTEKSIRRLYQILQSRHSHASPSHARGQQRSSPAAAATLHRSPSPAHTVPWCFAKAAPDALLKPSPLRRPFGTVNEGGGRYRVVGCRRSSPRGDPTLEADIQKIEMPVEREKQSARRPFYRPSGGSQLEQETQAPVHPYNCGSDWSHASRLERSLHRDSTAASHCTGGRRRSRSSNASPASEPPALRSTLNLQPTTARRRAAPPLLPPDESDDDGNIWCSRGGARSRSSTPASSRKYPRACDPPRRQRDGLLTAGTRLFGRRDTPCSPRVAVARPSVPEPPPRQLRCSASPWRSVGECSTSVWQHPSTPLRSGLRRSTPLSSSSPLRMARERTEPQRPCCAFLPRWSGASSSTRAWLDEVLQNKRKPGGTRHPDRTGLVADANIPVIDLRRDFRPETHGDGDTHSRVSTPARPSGSSCVGRSVCCSGRAEQPSAWALGPERDLIPVLPGRPAARRRLKSSDRAAHPECVLVEEVHLDENRRPYVIVKEIPVGAAAASQRHATERLSQPRRRFST